MNEHSYPAELVRVVDGDTVDLAVEVYSLGTGKPWRRLYFSGSLGFHIRAELGIRRARPWLRITTEQRFRLLGYNAPESRGAEASMGRIATQDLANRLALADEIRVESHKTGSFGRWLCELYLDGEALVPQLIAEGYGVPWDGKGRRPGFDTGGPYPLGVEVAA